MFTFKPSSVLKTIQQCSLIQKNKPAYIEKYKVIKEIGKGHYGTIIKVEKNNKTYALKRIDKVCKVNYEEPSLQVIKDHHEQCEYIVRFYKHLHVDKISYLVLELCEGIELFEYISIKSELSEYQSKKIIKMLSTAIQFLHNIHIVHRDIKPENIIVEYYPSNFDMIKKIKLCDFGLAKYLNDDFDKRMTTRLGTPYYMSPEVIHRNYNYLCDEWSIGVLLYILLCGYPPFNSEYDSVVMKKVKEKKVVFYKTEWEKYEHSPCINIITSLLEFEDKRINVDTCLKDAWFNDISV